MKKLTKFFTVTILSIIIFVAFSTTVLAAVKNIILMIGDGMGPAQIGAAWLYSNRVLKKELNMVVVMNSGMTGYMVNDTADSTVTESAAAATQMATGVKVTARALGMSPEGKPLETILEIAKKKGKATGLVTTSGITDATPGGFIAHVPDRGMEAEVADQMLKAEVEVLFGGRKRFFLPEAEKGVRKDGRNLINEARLKGYIVVQEAEELKMFKGAKKMLGLFNMGNMSYEIDRSETREPSLAEMTEKALEILSEDPDGFFLLVEGGRIDHASHRSDAAATIRDTLAFDEAVGVALEFQRRNPDTLLIVTADHDTGGLAIIGHSKVSREYVGIDLEAISKINASFETLVTTLGKEPSLGIIKQVILKYTDILITDEEADFIKKRSLNKLDPKNFSYEWDNTIGFVLRPYLRVGWVASTHTATPLFLFAKGPGAEEVVGFRHNTELFKIMMKAFGFAP